MWELGWHRGVIPVRFDQLPDFALQVIGETPDVHVGAVVLRVTEEEIRPHGAPPQRLPTTSTPTVDESVRCSTMARL
jgi:hypothetical protein